MCLKYTSSLSLTCPYPVFTRASTNNKVFSCSSFCSFPWSAPCQQQPFTDCFWGGRSANPFLTCSVGGKKSNIQDKNIPYAAAWLKHAVTRFCQFILCQLFLVAPSFLTYFKSASNSSTTSIYFLNTFIPLTCVFMVGSRCCKHSAEIRHLLAAAPGILTGYLPLFKLSKSGCFLNTIRTEV